MKINAVIFDIGNLSKGETRKPLSHCGSLFYWMMARESPTSLGGPVRKVDLPTKAIVIA